MEELLQKLQSLHGLSAEQSKGILATITGYIKEKFPMVGGAIDNFFPTGSTVSSTVTTNAQTTTTTASPDNASFLDKISDFIPGSAGEKIEEFAKDKLGGFFGEDKRV
jgi:hypothetical protein